MVQEESELNHPPSTDGPGSTSVCYCVLNCIHTGGCGLHNFIVRVPYNDSTGLFCSILTRSSQWQIYPSAGLSCHSSYCCMMLESGVVSPLRWSSVTWGLHYFCREHWKQCSKPDRAVTFFTKVRLLRCEVWMLPVWIACRTQNYNRGNWMVLLTYCGDIKCIFTHLSQKHVCLSQLHWDLPSLLVCN